MEGFFPSFFFRSLGNVDILSFCYPKQGLRCRPPCTPWLAVHMGFEILAARRRSFKVWGGIVIESGLSTRPPPTPQTPVQPTQSASIPGNIAL